MTPMWKKIVTFYRADTNFVGDILPALISETSPGATAGLHKSFHPTSRAGSTWSKFGARGEHGDVFLFSNLGAL